MQALLELMQLEKSFGSCEALRGVDMCITPGQIIGLLGPNASGKTTLLKIVSGLLSPTKGSLSYYNNIPYGPEARKTFSLCPDIMNFPSWMKVKDAFKFYEDMYDDYSHDKAEKIIDSLDLGQYKNSAVNRLSKGMKERLIFGLTFSRETLLYLLDEPLDGIDPVGKMRIIDTLIAMKPEGASVLISTHLVKDIERILDSVYFLSKGRIIFSGKCDSIREEKNQTVEQAYLEVFLHESTI